MKHISFELRQQLSTPFLFFATPLSFSFMQAYASSLTCLIYRVMDGLDYRVRPRHNVEFKPYSVLHTG
jgi:hypothetical protein